MSEVGAVVLLELEGITVIQVLIGGKLPTKGRSAWLGAGYYQRFRGKRWYSVGMGSIQRVRAREAIKYLESMCANPIG